MSITKAVCGAALLRFGLVAFAHLQDLFFDVKYTDIDYVVFTRAAARVYNGDSPYVDETYKYFPLLAWILMPNMWFADFGKLLFSSIDILVGWLIFQTVLLIEEREDSPSLKSGSVALMSSCLWLFNPVVFAISTRGSSEPLLSLLVVGAIYATYAEFFDAAALLHGLAVSLKLYPVIYIPIVLLHLSKRSANGPLKLNDILSQIFDVRNSKVIRYVVFFLLSFSFCTLVFYQCYGFDFIDAAYLYHFRRKDPQHNFSPYFYIFRLMDDQIIQTQLLAYFSVFAFIPQFFAVLYSAFYYHNDIALSYFVSTAYFVTFNKVCTSQYFVWYLSILPLLVPKLQISRLESCGLSVLWLFGQGLWLFFAYLYEFKHWQTLPLVWISSVLFLLINCFILLYLVRHYRFKKSYQNLKNQ